MYGRGSHGGGGSISSWLCPVTIQWCVSALASITTLLDVDVRHATSFCIAWNGFVHGLLWELGDNVPSVEQAGNETKHAEEDVDEGVGRAKAGFDPD